MAVSVESTTGQITYVAVTDVGSTGTFFVSKPSGLAVGEMLVVSFSVDGGTATDSADWVTISIPNTDTNTPQYLSYKIATAGDVAGSGWTFTSSDDSAEYVYFCYRLSGSALSIDPVIEKEGEDFTLVGGGSTSVSGSLSFYVPSGTLLLLNITANLGVDGGMRFSGYGVTGATASFTERIDDNTGSASDEHTALADGVTTTAGDLTAYNFTTASSPATDRTLFNNVFAIYPQTDATGTLEFVPEEDEAFDISGKSGVHGNIEFISGNDEVNDVSGKVRQPTRWTDKIKTGDTWTDKIKS